MSILSQWQHVLKPRLTRLRIQSKQYVWPQRKGWDWPLSSVKSLAQLPLHVHVFFLSSSSFSFLASSSFLSCRGSLFLLRISIWHFGQRTVLQCMRCSQFEHFLPWTNGFGRLRWCNSRTNIKFIISSSFLYSSFIFILFITSIKYNGDDCFVMVFVFSILAIRFIFHICATFLDIHDIQRC